MATQKLSIEMEGIPRNTGNTNSAKHWHRAEQKCDPNYLNEF